MNNTLNQNLITSAHRYKIEIITASDVQEFVSIASRCSGKVMLLCGDELCINAKSLLGVMLARGMHWNDLTLVTENDCYYAFEKFICL